MLLSSNAMMISGEMPIKFFIIGQKAWMSNTKFLVGLKKN